MRFIVLVGLVFVALELQGCAFHPSEEEVSGAVAETPKFSAVIKFGSTESEKPLVRRLVADGEGNQYILSAPVTLPASVPDHLSISFTLPSTDALQGPVRAEVKASASQEDSGTLDLPVSRAALNGVQDGTASIDVQVSGLKAVVTDARESAAWLSFGIYDKDRHRAYRISFRVLTPPSLVTFEQMLPANYVGSSNARLDPALFYLDAPNIQLTLLQVVRVTNSSKETVVVSLPRLLPGRVLSKVTTNQFERAQCSFTATSKQSEVDFSPTLQLYPLVLDLPHRFLTYTDETSLTVPAGQVAAFGIYGSGSQIRDFSKNGPSPLLQILSNETVPIGCDYQCPAGLREMGAYLDAWHCRTVGTPGCNGPRACLDCTRGSQCNLCFEQDAQPMDTYKRACIGDWRVTQKLKDVQLYAIREAIHLVIDGANLQAKLRYGFSSESDDPEFRSKAALIQSSVQWE